MQTDNYACRVRVRGMGSITPQKPSSWTASTMSIALLSFAHATREISVQPVEKPCLSVGDSLAAPFYMLLAILKSLKICRWHFCSEARSTRAGQARQDRSFSTGWVPLQRHFRPFPLCDRYMLWLGAPTTGRMW